MAQIQKGDTFTDGELVTASRLNQLLDSAIVNPEVIGDQALLATIDVNGSDEIMLKQNSSGNLKRVSINNIFTSGNLGFTTAQITGNSTGTLNIFNTNGMIYQSANTWVKIEAANGATNFNNGIELSSINTNGNIKIDAGTNNIILEAANLTLDGRASFNTTSAIKIPVGTQYQRPSVPVLGDSRYNTTIGATEIYDGSAWVNFSYQPKVYVKTGYVSPAAGTEFNVWSSPSLTIPADETWTYEINISTNSGYVTGSTRPDVNAIRFRVYNNSSQIFEQYGSCSPYGAHTGNWMFTKALTSGDNGFIFNAKILSAVSLDTPVYYRVTLTKVKTSTLSDASSCI